MSDNDLKRVVFRFSPERSGVFLDSPPEVPAMIDRATPLLDGIGTIGGVEPIIPGRRTELRLLGISRSEVEEEPDLDLAAYYHVFAVDAESAETLADRLRNEPDVSEVEVRHRPVRPYRYQPGPEGIEIAAPPPPAAPAGLGRSSTPSFWAWQRYLGPEGLDVLDAWTLSGGRGQGVHVLDVETHWNLQHEEHAGRAQLAMGTAWGGAEDRDHGTAVLGLTSASDSGAGVIGLAPSSHPRAASITWDSVNGRWNLERTLLEISRLYPRGTVVLLELQEAGPRWPGGTSDVGMLPVERWPSSRAAIRRLANLGYYVVEAAGNGSQDLDDPFYGGVFTSTDSGAILVGAGHSAFTPPARSRCLFSNHGSRLDVQAWGIDVASSGGSLAHYRDLYPSTPPFDPWRCYTRSFGGTSSASALIAGAVACIAGAVRVGSTQPLTAKVMRDLLRSHGSAQTDSPQSPATERIGPMPSVGAVLQALGLP